MDKCVTLPTIDLVTLLDQCNNPEKKCPSLCLCALANRLIRPKTVETITEVQEEKNRLNSTKSELDEKDIDAWKKHTRNTQLADATVFAVRNQVSDSSKEPLEMVTGAWCKMFEMLKLYHLLPLGQSKIRTAHLCECPGAFINATNAFIRLNSGLTDWEWNAISLNPFSEFNDPQAMIDDDAFYRETFQHWWRGSDDTGNILSYNNFSHVRDKIFGDYANRAYDFISADGSIDTQFDANEQESITAPLHMAEFIWAISILKQKTGSLCLKAFTLFEQHSLTLLFLMSVCFEEVLIVKPFLSKAGNSETYVIGRKFKGVSSKLLVPLSKTIGKGLNQQPLIPTSFLRERCPAFFKSYYTAANQFAKWQTQAIRRNLTLFENTIDSDNFRRLRSLKEKLALDWIMAMQLDQAPKKLTTSYRIVPRSTHSHRAFLSGANNNSTRVGRKVKVGGVQSDRLNAHLDHKDLIEIRRLAAEEGDGGGANSHNGVEAYAVGQDKSKRVLIKNSYLKLRLTEAEDDEEEGSGLRVVDTSDIILPHKRKNMEMEPEKEDVPPVKKGKDNDEEQNSKKKESSGDETASTSYGGGGYGFGLGYGSGASGYLNMGDADEEEEEDAFGSGPSFYNPSSNSHSANPMNNESTAIAKAAAAAESVASASKPKWMQFGLKLFSRMGYTEGQGLGETSEGIKEALSLEALGHDKANQKSGLNKERLEEIRKLNNNNNSNSSFISPDQVEKVKTTSFFMLHENVQLEFKKKQPNYVPSENTMQRCAAENSKLSNNREAKILLDWCFDLVSGLCNPKSMLPSRSGGWIEFAVYPQPACELLTSRFLTSPEKTLETALKLRFRLMKDLPATQVGDVLIRESAKYLLSPLSACTPSSCPPMWSLAVCEVLQRLQSELRVTGYLEINAQGIPWCAWIMKRLGIKGWVLAKSKVTMQSGTVQSLQGRGQTFEKVWDPRPTKDRPFRMMRDELKEIINKRCWDIEAGDTLTECINFVVIDACTPQNIADLNAQIGVPREPGAVELDSVSTLMASMLPALQALPENGYLLVRLSNCLCRMTVGLIAILATAFESTRVIRPFSVPGWTMERGIIFQKFKGEDLYPYMAENRDTPVPLSKRTILLTCLKKMMDVYDEELKAKKAATANKTDFIPSRMEQCIHPLFFTGKPFSDFICEANDRLITHEIADLESRISASDVYSPSIPWQTHLKPVLSNILDEKYQKAIFAADSADQGPMKSGGGIQAIFNKSLSDMAKGGNDRFTSFDDEPLFVSMKRQEEEEEKKNSQLLLHGLKDEDVVKHEQDEAEEEEEEGEGGEQHIKAETTQEEVKQEEPEPRADEEEEEEDEDSEDSVEFF
eukprot:GDKJ01053179.1.p1 GENE.GDKJ01053179.1~~GDKJ01053179.1.p1  ORF type:complete len:1366 (-),score=362.76 GDKJ01053179.1:138-4181(-)